MQVRCQNCGARLSVPPGELREIKCPRCGVLMMLPPPNEPVDPESRSAARRARTSLKRVYEPIPRPVVYLAGAGLALLLTSPFWIYVLKERWTRRPPIIEDDTATIVVPESSSATTTSAPLLAEGDVGTLSFDRFHGVRLESGRDDMQRRFNMRLQNTRGMVPEIYEADRLGDFEQLLAYFYGNALKEFSFTMRERRDTPDAAQQELMDQFGEPQQVVESDNTSRGLGVGLPGISSGNSDFTAKFPRRRDLTWFDDQNRVDATIYYNATDIMLSVRVSAATWLKANKPLVNPNVPVVSNVFERPVLPEPAPRAFP